MSQEFERWRREVGLLPRYKAEFEKWFFINIASVLFSGKAGELLMLKRDCFEAPIEEQIEKIALLSESWEFSYLTLCESDKCFRVIIYNREELEKTLSSVPGWVLDLMGYHREIGHLGFLEEVGRRWRHTGQIPHEIGLALGYPIKDVLGFLGVIDLDCKGSCGWKIYGDPYISLKMSSRYFRAREEAKMFVSQQGGC